MGPRVKGVFEWTGQRAGWSGLAGGFAIGVAATLLVTTYLVPRLDPDAPRESGTLVILSGTDDGFGDQRQALIDQWNALTDRPDAEIIPIAGGTTAQRAEMVEYAQAGGRNVDIYNLDVTLIAEFVDFGYIRLLDESQVDFDGFLARPLQTCRRNDKLWALPFNTDAALLYYRTDLVPAGPAPTSWAGITNAVEATFAAPRRPNEADGRLVAGYAGQLADYEGLTVNAIEAIWAAGGDVVDDEGNVVVDTPETREGLRRLAAGLAPGNPQLILPDSRKYDEGGTTQAFRDGRVIFMRNWPVAYRGLGGGEPGEPTVAFDVARIPGRSVLGGQNLAIAANSDQPRAAQDLIEFLTSARSQQILFERGGFAATREIVYQDSAVRANFPYAVTLLDAIKQADLRPVTPYYAMFSETFREGVRYALGNGGELPPKFTTRLANALKGITTD
jgi:multiple sugar transport system substrate-binding protein